MMGLSLMAVKSLLNRAKENLREALARELKEHLEGSGDSPSSGVMQ
jgi:DNA-directed RNA polymerase specialized sigma24 family protein